MEAVCELVTHSRVPWSPEVEALVQEARQSRLPQVAELERHCQFVQLKSVAHTYNFTPAELEYLPVRKPRGIIRKIIYSGAANSLEDALKVRRTAFHFSVSMGMVCQRVHSIALLALSWLFISLCWSQL